MTREEYTKINAETIDAWVEGGWEWGVPITHEQYERAQGGDWNVVLTPIINVPKEWFPPLGGARVLGLASGGGQQMPVFAALGARCAVLDYSDRQLESERVVALREGYDIDIIKGDMTKRLPFEDSYFDMVFHPISNCYIEDVCHVWNECFRILKSGGVLLAGMDNGINFLVDEENPLKIAHKLPVNPLKNASDEEIKRMIENRDGIQFSHTLEEQIGGQLKAGFRLTHLYEDRDREGVLPQYAPQYIATRAVKP